MFKIFGSARKFIYKEGGKTIDDHECPHCHARGTFKEVTLVEYIAVFFFPILKEKRKSLPNNPYFACPNCKEVFLFYRQRSVYSGYIYTFQDYVNLGIRKVKTLIVKPEDRSKKSRAARDVEKELKSMERKMTNDAKGGLR